MTGNQESFFDLVTTTTEDDTQDYSKPAGESKGMLQRILKESSEVVGSFGNDITDTDTSISSKLNKIQELENIALAESIKSFDADTLDERRLFASNNLLKIASTLKGTLVQKHKLELIESVDFTNPKVSAGLNFFLELFVKTLTEEGIGGNQLTKILEVLEVQLYDFETVLQEIFHQVPLNDVNKIANPFLDKLDEEAEVEPQEIFKDKPTTLDAELVPKKKKSLKERIKLKRAKKAKGRL